MPPTRPPEGSLLDMEMDLVYNSNARHKKASFIANYATPKFAFRGIFSQFDWNEPDTGDKSVSRAEVLDAGDPARAARIYRDFLRDPLHAYRETEPEMNTLGYELMNARRMDDALAVFKLIVEMHPASWNAYDSLGEAHFYRGEKELAIQNYEKSLELNPNNGNAVEMLARINAH